MALFNTKISLKHICEHFHNALRVMRRKRDGQIENDARKIASANLPKHVHRIVFYGIVKEKALQLYVTFRINRRSNNTIAVENVHVARRKVQFQWGIQKICRCEMCAVHGLFGIYLISLILKNCLLCMCTHNFAFFIGPCTFCHLVTFDLAGLPFKVYSPLEWNMVVMNICTASFNVDLYAVCINISIPGSLDPTKSTSIISYIWQEGNGYNTATRLNVIHNEHYGYCKYDVSQN